MCDLQMRRTSEKRNITAFLMKKRRRESIIKMNEQSHGKDDKNHPATHELSACSLSICSDKSRLSAIDTGGAVLYLISEKTQIHSNTRRTTDHCFDIHRN